MAALLAEMLRVLLAWAVLTPALIGIGLATYRLLRFRTTTAQHLLLAFWLGWVLVVGVLQLWHLFAPIQTAATLLVLALGWGGLAMSADTLRGFLPRLGRAWPLLLAIGLVGIYLANRALLPPLHYDTGLYHLQSVRWAENYAIVPGLGHLHGPLAQNTSYHLYVAFLGAIPGIPEGYNLSNGLLTGVLLAQVMLRGYQLIAHRRPIDTLDLMWALPVFVIILDAAYPTGPTTDQPVFALSMVYTLLLFEMLSAEPDMATDRYRLFMLAALTTGGLLTKLSAAVPGAVTGLVALGVWLWRYRRSGWPAFRPLLPITGLVLVLLVPWLVRGAVLSGWVLYPSTFLPLPVEWRLTEMQVVYDRMQMVVMGRLGPANYEPGHIYNEWAWLGPWFQRATTWIQMIVAYALFVPAVLFAAAGLVLRRRLSQLRRLWVLLPSVLGILFWFFSAPDFRFSFALHWMLTATTVALVAEQWRALRHPWVSRVALGLALVPGLLLFLALPFTRPDDDFGFGVNPEIELVSHTTESGLTIYEPARIEDECWDSHLLCTPFPNPRTALREPGNLQRGFMALRDGYIVDPQGYPQP